MRNVRSVSPQHAFVYGKGINAEESPPLESPNGCPKCRAPRSGDACKRCGLVCHLWKGAPDISASEETRRAWAALFQAFHDPTEHEHFLAHCLSAGALSYAAARYAEIERTGASELRSIASVRRRQVAVMAEAAYLPPRKEEDRVFTRKATLFAGGVILVSLVPLMGSLVSKMKQLTEQRTLSGKPTLGATYGR